jgi:hypothetical protein
MFSGETAIMSDVIGGVTECVICVQGAISKKKLWKPLDYTPVSISRFQNMLHIQSTP